MTQSNKLSKFLSSIKTHIHPESTEKHENKKDTEKNVQRVLQLLTTEENDPLSINSGSKSELASLIKDIYKGYESLYGRYDELTENLKKKFHKKGDGNGSFSLNSSSFSSDSSDSSDSETEHLKIHRGEAEMSISIDDYKTLQLQLEGTSRRNHELETEIASMNAKITAFEGIEAKLSEVQDTNGVLENKIQVLEKNMKLLQADIADFEQKLEASAKQEQELNQRIGTMCEENENLKAEEIKALHNTQELEIRLEQCVSERSLEVTNLNQKYYDLNNEKEALELENSDLLGKVQGLEEALADQQNKANLNLELARDELFSKITQLLSENDTLKLKQEAADKKGHELISRLKYTEEDNGALKSEINDLKNSMSDENIKFLNITNDLNKQLEDKEAECKNLASQHREAALWAQEEEKQVEMLTLEMKELKNNTSEAYEALKLKLESKEQEELKLKEISEALMHEKHALTSQNDELARRVELSNREVTDLKDQKLQLELEKSELQAMVENLETKIEAKEWEGTTLRKLFDAINDERHYLILQNRELLTKVEHSERNIADLKIQWDQLEAERSEIQVRMENLQSTLKSTNVEFADSKRSLQANVEKIATLSKEKSDLFSELEQERSERKELQLALEHLKEESTILRSRVQEYEKITNDSEAEIEQLKSSNGQLQIQLNDISHQLKVASHEQSEVSKQNEFLEEEKLALISKLQQGEADFRRQQNELEELTKENSILQQRNKDMNDRASDLDSKLEEKISEISTIQQTFRETQDEANTQIQTISVFMNHLLAEKDFLCKQKSELEDQMKIIGDGCIEQLSLFRKLEDEVTEKFTKQETLMESLRSSLNNLQKEYKKLKNCFIESCQKLDSAGAVSEKQMKEINNLVERGNELQENINLCESEKAELSREVSGLRGQLEAQSCLFKQKLKITETEYREKEERHTDMIEKLQGNLKELKNELTVVYGNLNLLRSEFSRTIDVVEHGNSDFCQELYKLLSLFEQKHYGIDGQVSSLITEAKNLKEKLHQQISEKQEMKEAMQDMEVRLKKSEGSITSLEHKTRELSVQLAGKDKEMEKVVMRSVEYDRMLKELEKSVKEKEEEIAARKEEKLEAINQLCLMIDYQLEKYNQLNEYVATAIRSSRRLVIA